MEPKLFSLSAVLVLSYVHVSCQVDGRCYNTSTSTHQHCFKSPGGSNLLSFSTAVANCTGNYSLVAVADEEMRQFVMKFLIESELTSDDVWLGITRTTDNMWKQVDGSNYTGHIDAPAENLTSVYIKFSSSLNKWMMFADVSHTTRDYICQFDRPDLCQQFSNKTTTGFGCYVKFPMNNDRAKLPWHDARNKCLFHNGDLAHSDVLNNMVLESGKEYWIGISRDPLMWINYSDTSKYSQVKYSYFSRGQPSVYNMNTTCIVMSYGSQWAWSSKGCSEKQLVVCQSVTTLGQSTTDAVRFTTSGTDSANTTAAAAATTTTTTSSSSSSSTNNTGLTPGAVGGIIAGCVAFYILSIVVAVVIACYCCKKESGRATNNSHRSSNPYGREPSRKQSPTDSPRTSDYVEADDELPRPIFYDDVANLRTLHHDHHQPKPEDKSELYANAGELRTY